MGGILTTDNETWKAIQEKGKPSKIANFDYFVKFTGKTVVGFKGIMFACYECGE